jgi:hypothetical protein
MSKTSRTSIILMIVLLASVPLPVSAASAEKVIPTFSVVSVVPNSSVTIETFNFPAYDVFDVLMGYMGTRGINGIKVASVASGAGGSIIYTFKIPAALFGQDQIAIRLQSSTGSCYYAYNWFPNQAYGIGTGGRGPARCTCYPTFWISAVVRDSSVTIVTQNLPPNDQFDVLMGPIGTRGVNGYWVTTINSGVGGSQTMTFSIPPPLYGSYKIAIRLQSASCSGYYAYNWFFNNTTY